MRDVSLIPTLLAFSPAVDQQKALLETHATVIRQEKGLATALAMALKDQQIDQLIRRQDGLATARESADLLTYLHILTGNQHHKAIELCARGNIAGNGEGNYAAAIQFYDDAAHIYEHELGDMESWATTQIGRIPALHHLDDSPHAPIERTIMILQTRQNWVALGAIFGNLAFIDREKGDIHTAITCLNKAAYYFDKLGASGAHHLQRVQINKIPMLTSLGQLDGALRLAQQMQIELDVLGHTFEMIRMQEYQAHILIISGRLTEAMHLLKQVATVYQSRHHEQWHAEEAIVDCLMQLHQFEYARERIAAQLQRDIDYLTPWQQAQLQRHKAHAEAQLGRIEDALMTMGRARSLCVLAGMTLRTAEIDLERASLALLDRDPHSALTIALGVLDVLDAGARPLPIARARLLIAKAAEQSGNQSLAVAQVAKVQQIAEQLDSPNLLSQAAWLRGRLAHRNGNRPMAITNYAAAIDNLERALGRIMVEFRPDFLERRESVYEELVELLLTAGHYEKALGYAERCKSRALLDLLAHRVDLRIRPKRAAHQTLVDNIQHLERERNRVWRQWNQGEMQQTDARQAIIAHEKSITRLWQDLLISSTDYAHDAALRQVRSESIQPLLAADTLLIEYFVVHGCLIVFLVSAETVETCKLDVTMPVIQRLQQSFELNRQRFPTNNLRQAEKLTRKAKKILGRVYQQLIAPFATSIAAYEKLIIVPHGLLHRMPLHAAFDGSHYLIEKVAVSYLPSSSLLRYCRAVRPQSNEAVAFGYSQSGHLVHAPQEAQQVADMLSGRCFLEEDVTLDRLRDSAESARILHLATHGNFNSRNPLFSRLQLHDGDLTTLNIFDLKLNASLVTLSACETGSSHIGGGDEQLGLMRAFLHAGAASLLLTQWRVYDTSTLHFMTCFYEHLMAGKTKAVALQMTQVAFLQTNSFADENSLAVPYAHPYYWAGFFLVGDNLNL
ncbi:MAG: CHAT domain-containing protein [Candidatus Promineifilaceae bacterium]